VVIAAPVVLDHAPPVDAAPIVQAPGHWIPYALVVLVSAILGAVVAHVAVRRRWLNLSTRPAFMPRADDSLLLAALFLLLLLAPSLSVPSVRGAVDVTTMRGMAMVHWTAYATQAPIAALLVWMLRRSDQTPAPFRSAVGTSVVAIACVAPWIVLGNQLATQLQALLTGVEPSEIAHKTLGALIESRGDPWALAVIAAVVIAAPVIEEIAYRGGLQGAIRALGIGAWPSILITSGAFAAMHIPSVPVESLAGAMASLFLLSVMLGLIRERTQGLIAPIVAHALFNAANLALAWTLVQ